MRENRIGSRDIGQGSHLFSGEGQQVLGRYLPARAERQAKIGDDRVVSECRLGLAQARNSDVKIPVSVKAVDKQQLRAFALPGGFLFLCSDLRPKASNAAEVAS